MSWSDVYRHLHQAQMPFKYLLFIWRSFRVASIFCLLFVQRYCYNLTLHPFPGATVKLYYFTKKGMQVFLRSYIDICTWEAFHRILSLRLEKFVFSNKLLDSSIQKGFLHGINSTMEHFFSNDSLLANARSFKQAIFMSFLDLKNSFGSVCHRYVSF